MRKLKQSQVLIIGSSGLVVLLLIALLLFSNRMHAFLNKPLLATGQSWYFVLKPGQSLTQVTTTVQQHTQLQSPWLFKLYAKAEGYSRHLQAGGYVFHGPLYPKQFLGTLRQGDVYKSQLTIVDGWRWQQLQQNLANNRYLDNDLASLNRHEIADKLQIAPNQLDGMLYPDTYHFPAASKASAVLLRAKHKMQQVLANAWLKRQAHLPYDNPDDMLTAASLVEQEATKNQEKPLIAGVLVNRLRRNMRLQFDPTVVYALGPRYQGQLQHADMRTASPYNTYLHKGLPPGPIAYPDLASIMAVVNPKPTNMLYFFATSNGHHVFAKTLKQHDRHIRKFSRKDGTTYSLSPGGRGLG